MADLNRATELSPEIVDAVDDMFEFHPWDEAMIERGKVVRRALSDAVKVIIATVPPSADRSTAIRKLREARMDCNSAITHDGRF